MFYYNEYRINNKAKKIFTTHQFKQLPVKCNAIPDLDYVIHEEIFEIIPNLYFNCPSQTYKPSTYWPNKYMLIYVFNGNISIIK